jgi:hypothetical protein
LVRNLLRGSGCLPAACRRGTCVLALQDTDTGWAVQLRTWNGVGKPPQIKQMTVGTWTRVHSVHAVRWRQCRRAPRSVSADAPLLWLDGTDWQAAHWCSRHNDANDDKGRLPGAGHAWLLTTTV